MKRKGSEGSGSCCWSTSLITVSSGQTNGGALSCPSALQKRLRHSTNLERSLGPWNCHLSSVWWGTWQNNALKRLDRRGPSETCPARFDQSTAVFLASCCLGFLYSRRFHVTFMRRWDELQGIVVASIIGQHVQGKGKRKAASARGDSQLWTVRLLHVISIIRRSMVTPCSRARL